MKILQVIPNNTNGPSLKSLLKAKERSLRGTGPSFFRAREGRWTHARYSGWINWEETTGGILLAEIRTRTVDSEWQLLQSFIGYLDRHLGKHIGSMFIIYR